MAADAPTRDEVDDLFGSDDDAPPPAATQAEGTAPAAEPGMTLEETLDQDLDDDLFGSESEDMATQLPVGTQVGATQAFGATQAMPGETQREARDLEMEELFGTGFDDDDLFGDQPTQVPSKAPVDEKEERRKLLERDLFGSSSEEEEIGAADTIEIPDMPMPSGRLCSFRVPNILEFEQEPFDEKTWGLDDRGNEKVDIGFQEIRDSEGRVFVKLKVPESCVRWRWKRDEQGQVVTYQGVPVKESNTRVVEWDDGTMTMFVGREPMDMRVHRKLGDVFVYADAEYDGTVKVQHGILEEQLTVTPYSLHSKTHQLLKDAQINKIKPVKRTGTTTMEEVKRSVAETHAPRLKNTVQAKAKKRGKDDGILRGADLEAGATKKPRIEEELLPREIPLDGPVSADNFDFGSPAFDDLPSAGSGNLDAFGDDSSAGGDGSDLGNLADLGLVPGKEESLLLPVVPTQEESQK